MFRTGFGFDVHRLKKKYPLFIGGVLIPSDKGAVGHSDADVLIHAICDALLGAASLKDIGYHFPDNSDEYKNIDSKILLNKVVELITINGYKIVNIDSTVCLETPKISSFIPEIIKVLANILGIEQSQFSVKATTTEKLGYTGKRKGISAYAVALVKKIN